MSDHDEYRHLPPKCPEHGNGPRMRYQPGTGLPYRCPDCHPLYGRPTRRDTGTAWADDHPPVSTA